MTTTTAHTTTHILSIICISASTKEKCRDSEAGENAGGGGGEKLTAATFYNLPILVYNRSHKKKIGKGRQQKKGTKGKEEKENPYNKGRGGGNSESISAEDTM